MAKSKKKIKDRKPKVGDTVFLRDNSKYLAMTLTAIFKRDKLEYGNCVWANIKMGDNEFKSDPSSGVFLLSSLTLIAPATLDGLYLA